MKSELHSLRGKLLKYIRVLDENLKLFQQHDVIVLGISGGYDSITLTDIITQYNTQRRLSLKIYPVFVNNHFKPLLNEDKLRKLLQERGLELTILEDAETEKNIKFKLKPFNPCFICSRERKKKLLEFAYTLKSNKVLLAHTLDDAIETLFLNILYSRGISTIMPVQPLFQGKFFIARPFIFVEKSLVKKYATLLGIDQKLEGECPYDRSSKRSFVREFLHELYAKDPIVKNNIKHALFHCNEKFLWHQYIDLKELLL
jgi:tRNA 2-thiocytidine biosynthesis protein TtcA